MRYKITLSYSGADFCGWQVQPREPSVQQTLEDALSSLLGSKICVTGAGRTDTGVNAVNYAAHFDLEAGIDCAQTRYKLNAILPRSIVVTEVTEVPVDFHARFGATRREYTYFLHTVKDPFIANYSLQYFYPLDFEAMNRASKLLLGTHDFSCFEKTGADNKTSVCTIFEAGWHKYTPSHVSILGREDGEYWYFRISADRFLRNMVRAIVGTLLETGRGKRSEDSIPELIESKDRCLAGESVPGYPLFLSDIKY